MGKIQYKISQYHNSSSAYNNFYYPRAVTVGRLTTSEIASSIEKRCTLTKADIMACLSALADVINEGITDSKAVFLDGIGSFRAGIVTKEMVEKVKDFTVAEQIAGYKVNFLPEFTADASGKKTNKLLVGAGVTEYAEYAAGVNATEKNSDGDYVSVTLQKASKA